VFSYDDRPLTKIHTSAWKRAWLKSGLPDNPAIRKGVHNLRHTYGRRLRAAGIPLETRKVLLGHASGDITTHYSAAEIDELLVAAEKIADRGVAQTPTLTLIAKGEKPVGKMSENGREVSSC